MEVDIKDLQRKTAVIGVMHRNRLPVVGAIIFKAYLVSFKPPEEAVFSNTHHTMKSRTADNKIPTSKLYGQIVQKNPTMDISWLKEVFQYYDNHLHTPCSEESHCTDGWEVISTMKYVGDKHLPLLKKVFTEVFGMKPEETWALGEEKGKELNVTG